VSVTLFVHMCMLMTVTGQHGVACRKLCSPSFLYIGYQVILRVKQAGYGVDHLPPSSSEVKERVKLCHCSPFWAFMTSSRVNFTFYLLALWGIKMQEFHKGRVCIVITLVCSAFSSLFFQYKSQTCYISGEWIL